MSWKLLIGVIMVSAVPAYNGFVLDYWDCLNPTSVVRTDASQVCNQPESNAGVSRRVMLVQKKTITRTTGFRCQVRVSTFSLYCGAYAHVKWMKIPDILHQVPVSTTWCRTMATQQRFQPPGSSESFKIQLNQEEKIAVQMVGELTIQNDQVYCKGQSYRTPQGILDNVLILNEYSVSIVPEEFIAHGSLVESQSDHVSLPCKLNQQGCEGDATYIWESPSGCSMETIQMFSGTPVQETYLVDHEKKILINQTGITISPANCGGVKLRSTNYEELYIAETRDTLTWPKLHPMDYSPSLNERIREDYMILYVENKINNLQAVRSSDLCQQRTGSFSEEPQPLGDGSYMLRRGDIIFQMRCPKKRGAITEKPACYSHIPLDGDLWIHPISRLRSIHSTMTVCNQKFPLTIRIQEGTWIAINPQIIPVATPTSRISEKLGNQVPHLDMSLGGAYTIAEAAAWEQILSFPTYHQALLKEVSVGVCINSGECPTGIQDTGVPQYTLEGLSQSLGPFSVRARVDQWIHQWGDYLAGICLIWLTGKVVVNFIILAMAWITNGPSTVLALLFKLCCGVQSSLHRIKKKQRKEDRKVEEGIKRRSELQEITTTPFLREPVANAPFSPFSIDKRI